ncbi:S8 family serine peptidase [Novilysobacter erysipheiresistens]|uniref:S8 family serine peptidase n=1 Tax=Novilysobacter erysipheiresistens TaxID=1749332 RepID=A0ABU7YX33_9GAMM
MTFRKNVLASALAVAVGSVVAGNAVAANPQRLVVNLTGGADAAAIAAQLEAAPGVEVVRVFDDFNAISVRVDADVADPSLASLAGIKSYELDAPRKVLADSYEDVTDGGETIPWGIQAVQAGDVSYMGGKKVCIVDTGYDLGHPDLQTVGVDGEDEGAGAWNGSADAPLHYHGTHVAGTIAAIDDDDGVVGVVGDGTLDLHIVRVFDEGGGFVYASDLAGAMLDCAAAGSDIISMSLGSVVESRVERQVTHKLDRQGVLLIAAAGNDGNATFSYPASYDSVVSVAAVDNDLVHAGFSQRNAAVQLAGPGVDTVSTVPRSEGFLYGIASGTSMATPHVAGVAALVWSNVPSCSNHELLEALDASARDLGTAGWDYRYGYGLVQARAAVDYLAANPCN